MTAANIAECLGITIPELFKRAFIAYGNPRESTQRIAADHRRYEATGHTPDYVQTFCRKQHERHLQRVT